MKPNFNRHTKEVVNYHRVDHSISQLSRHVGYDASEMTNALYYSGNVAHPTFLPSCTQLAPPSQFFMTSGSPYTTSQITESNATNSVSEISEFDRNNVMSNTWRYKIPPVVFLDRFPPGIPVFEAVRRNDHDNLAHILDCYPTAVNSIDQVI
jgi:hypothetical protein